MNKPRCHVTNNKKYALCTVPTYLIVEKFSFPHILVAAADSFPCSGVTKRIKGESL